MNFFSKLAAHKDLGLLALRLVVGATFIFHGIGKWGMWDLEPNEQLTEGTLNLMKFLSVVEPLGGLALVFGFLTSWAALGLAIIMAGAIYMKSFVWGMEFAGESGTGWEFDLALLAMNFHLFLTGSGKFGLDKYFSKHK